jgi:hypothetical protein
MKSYTVVLDVFDGQQYGMLPLAVLAWSEDEARHSAITLAMSDGWQRVRVMFTW